MGFNEILQRAKQRKEEADSKKSGGTTFLYPGDGSTSFRLLYNPATNNIFRTISRHWSDKLKKHVPCLSMYGLPCPFCEAKKLVEQSGQKPGWKLDPQSRVIFHATYNSADKPSSDKVKQGDTVVIMAAPSVENKFNDLFVDDLADALDAVLTDRKGLLFNLKRVDDGGFTKYEVVPSPTKKVESAATDEEMVKLLEELPDISGMYFPKEVNDDVKKNVIEATEQAMIDWGLDPATNKVLQDLKGSHDSIPPVPGQE